jgi:hypothetical protein
MFVPINSVFRFKEFLHSPLLLALSCFHSHYKYDRSFVGEHNGAVWLTPCLISELIDGVVGRGGGAVSSVVNTVEVS